MIRKEWLKLKKKKIPSTIDDFHQTLLFKARNKAEVNWLLANGVDIHHRDQLGRTALWSGDHYDPERKDSEVINTLFESGANADILDNEGNTVLSNLCFFTHYKLFIKHKNKYTTRNIQINHIYGNQIGNMRKAINSLNKNGFHVYYNTYLMLDIDITMLDEYNLQHLNVQQKQKIKNYNSQKRDDYIVFF